MDDERLKNLGGGGYFKELFLNNLFKKLMKVKNLVAVF